MKNTEKDIYTMLAELDISFTPYKHVPMLTTKEYDFYLPEVQVKNLLLKGKRTKQYYFVILHETKEIDLRGLATMLGEKRLSFATEDDLLQLFGLTPGMLSPLSLMCVAPTDITLVIDTEFDHTKSLGMHPNMNTTTLMIKYSDFVRFLEHFEHKPMDIKIPAKKDK